MNIQGTLFRKPPLATSITGKAAGLHGSNTYFQTKLSLPNRLETNTKDSVTLRFGQAVQPTAPISVNLQVLPLDLSVCRMGADHRFFQKGLQRVKVLEHLQNR